MYILLIPLPILDSKFFAGGNLNLLKSPNKNEAGGLSGKPLTDRSTDVIRFLHQKSNNTFPIIGVGGIHSPQDALDKLSAGASLVQLYSGFVYEGPSVVKKINKAILNNTQIFF